MNEQPCPYCDTWQDDEHEPGECLLIGTGQPGRDRRAYEAQERDAMIQHANQPRRHP